MSDKNRGEPVFTNVDEVLADRIVSRSKENAGIEEEEEKQQSFKESAQTLQNRPDRTLFFIKAALVALVAATFYLLLRSRKRR